MQQAMHASVEGCRGDRQGHKLLTAAPGAAAWHSRWHSLPTMLTPSCFDIVGEHPWLSLCETC